jgi:hypothetical protein
MIARLISGVLFLAVLGACSEKLSLEQQIVLTINQMEVHAEAGERRPFMNRVNDEFVGQEGGLSKGEFQRFMIMQWNVNQRLRAQLGPISVSALGPDTASASFHGLITGGRGFLPDRGQFFQFETTWVQNGGDWLLASARWTPIQYINN